MAGSASRVFSGSSLSAINIPEVVKKLLTSMKPAALTLLILGMGGSSHGQIYVGGYFNYIEEYDGSGASLTNFGGAGNPIYALALDGKGNLFVSSSGHGSYPFYDLYKFTASGTKLDSFHIQTTDYLRALAADGEGRLFVGNSSQQTIMLYDSSGALLNPSLISGLSDPYKIVLDGKGNLFVANRGNGTIGEYTTSGSTVNAALISGLNCSFGLRIVLDGNGHIFAACWPGFGSGVIGEYTAAGGTVNASLISIGDPPDLAIAPNGNLLILDYGGTIHEYTTSGVAVNQSFATGANYPLAMVSTTPDLRIESNDSSFGVQSNGFGFKVTGPANQTAVVEFCTNITSPTWLPMQTNTLSGGWFDFRDPTWAGYVARFYRVRLE